MRPAADLRLVGPAAGCWVVTVVGIVGGWGAALATALTVALVVVVVLALAVRGLMTRAVVWTVLAGSGVTVGFAVAVAVRAHAVQTAPMATVFMGHKTTVDLVITDDPRMVRGPGPQRVRVSGRAVPVGEHGGRVPVTVTAPASGWEALLPGQHVLAVVTVTPPQRRDLTAAVLRASGPPRAARPPPGHQRWAAGVRSRLSATSRIALPARESGLLPGMVIGDVGGLDDALVDDFRRCGLSHLVAVSGANVAIVAGTVLVVLRMCGVPRGAAVALAIAVVAVFVIVVRPSPSVVRAAVMGVVGMLALAARRDGQPVPALCTAVVAVLGLWPAMAVDPGFALSVAATAGLVVAAPRVRDALVDGHVPRLVAEPIAIAATAQVVTTPLVVLFAGSVSVVGVVANIVVAPVVAPITVLGTAAAVCTGFAAVLAQILARLTGPELWWMVVVADGLADVPGASISVPDGAIGAVVTATVIACGVAVVVVWSRRRTADDAVGARWQHGHRERPPAPRPRRRRLPDRARGRGHPGRGDP
ncbi:ComEC/Rec2 family competence protein [Williamsia sp. SKLECPSW1]